MYLFYAQLYRFACLYTYKHVPYIIERGMSWWTEWPRWSLVSRSFTRERKRLTSRWNAASRWSNKLSLSRRRLNHLQSKFPWISVTRQQIVHLVTDISVKSYSLDRFYIAFIFEKIFIQGFGATGTAEGRIGRNEAPNGAACWGNVQQNGCWARYCSTRK